MFVKDCQNKHITYNIVFVADGCISGWVTSATSSLSRLDKLSFPMSGMRKNPTSEKAQERQDGLGPDILIVKWSLWLRY